MNDKELLEFAAKAAGYDIDFEESGPLWYALGYDENGDVDQWWNPLEDDACALRMAVKLNLRLLPYPDDKAIRVTRLDQKDTIVSWGTPADPYAATRRAIVIAAAEIGKEMP